MTSAPRLLVAVIMAVVLTASAVACGSDDGRELPAGTASSAPSDEVERRELHLPSYSVVDDEVWVFGGVSGPADSSPPTSSDLPDGWRGNDLALVYGSDGVLRRWFSGPELRPAISGGQVFAVGDDHYLLTNHCRSPVAGGCAGSTARLIRFADGDVDVVPLEMPPRPGGDDPSTGHLHVLGRDAEGTIWATEVVPTDSYLPVTNTRLLAITLDPPVVTEVPRPDGTYLQGTACLDGAHVYAIQAELGDSVATAVRLLRRPATVAPTGWDLLAEPIEDPARATGGALHCMADRTLGLSGQLHPGGRLLTLSSATGEPVAAEVRPGAQVIGDLDGITLAARPWEGDLLLRPPGGQWQTSEVRIGQDATLVVFDGAVRDISGLLTSTRPPAQAPPVVFQP